jgi:hypothetical protein
MKFMRPSFLSRRIALRRNAVLPLAALVLAAPSHARQDAVFSPGGIQAQITYLASDELRGRMSGEPGHEKAAQFAAREFAKYGLKPLGTSRQRDPNAPMDGSGYYQPFKFIAGRAVGKGNFLQATLIGKTRAYRAGQDYDPSGVSGGGKAEGEVVFVGYGIRAPQANQDDYANRDVKGKIVLLLAGSPGDDPHGPLYAFGDIRRKALTARELGAPAVLVITPKNADTLEHARFDFADASDAGMPVLRLRRSVAESWLHADDKALDTLESDAAARKNVSAALPVRVRLAADVKKVVKITANVVGMIEGSDPVLKNEYVVVGAHLDHWGMGGPGSLARSSEPAIHHGADDNASGSAGVLQLAAFFGGQGHRVTGQEAVASSPRPPLQGRSGPQPRSGLAIPGPRLRRSLLFMCFSGEELGLLGSDYYVKHPLVPLDKTVAMLNMDMIGRLRDNKLIVIGSGTAKAWDSLLKETNATAKFDLARSESGFGASDQQSFYTQNIPVLFFFTGTHADYHTPTDTADKINAEGEARVLKMVADCAARIADNPDRPTFQRVKTPDQNAPSRSFAVYFGSVPDYAAQVEGVQLNGVREGSPAEKAGLKAGDIIVKFGDRTIKNIYDYTYALQDHKPGDQVAVIVKRGAETLTLMVTLAARPER